jgi:DNA polymerase
MPQINKFNFFTDVLGVSEIINTSNETTLTAEVEDKLESLKSIVLECSKCKLAETRTKIVFGEGNPNAKLMFVGEGPGYDEDIQGRPFVGKAGQLLTKMIEAMGLSRQEVYIANIVKCRPPGNRNPLKEEIFDCIGYLHRQIEIIEPEIIICLGSVAAHSLLNVETPISKLRGNFLDFKGIKVMPTFHPAYLLRNERMKKPAWQDLQAVMKEMGL